MDEREKTARGHDVALIEEMLALTPEERLERNCQQATVLLELRASLRREIEAGSRPESSAAPDEP